MARQEIDLTTPQPNGKMGEPTKSAWEKVNDMTLELYEGMGAAIQLSGKNMLINCGLPVNQRQFGGGALAAGSYGYDRWKAGTGGCNISINQTSGLFTHTSGPLQQIVELPLNAWGRELTFSVENPTGTVQVSVGGASGSISSGTGRRGITLTPTGSGNMTVQITATGATYLRPQLERGGSPTEFDARPSGIEVLLCQRYYWRSGIFVANNYLGLMTAVVPSGAESRANACLFFPVPMRATPSITTFNPNNGNSTSGLLSAGGNVNYQSIDYDSLGIYQFNFASAQVAGRSFILKVGIDAEL